MKIIGLCLIRNEDVFIEQAIRNSYDFCDHIHIYDHASTDNTPEILQRLSAELPKITVKRIEDTRESNNALKNYMGTDTWVLGIDGDELYDPVGLASFRNRLAAGEFDEHWMIYGNVFHCNELDDNRQIGSGYLAPPCRSMTKLYNFSLIDDWPVKDQRMHGLPVFKEKAAGRNGKYPLFEAVSWEDSEFRCLHVPFLRRSSQEKSNWSTGGVRLNPTQNYIFKKLWKRKGLLYAIPRMFRYASAFLFRRDEKHRRYAQGPIVSKNVSCFFDSQNTDDE
jgi:glycosyltransferase involved in cell wall biosynthesis